MVSEVKKDVIRLVESFPHVENGEVSDVIVKTEKELLVVLAERNASKVSKRKAGETTMLAKSIGARPLVVAERIGTEELLDEVVYEKHGLPVVNIETFQQILEGEEVFIRKYKSMYLVKINPKKLRKAREERNISLGALADYLGVSRKSVYEYERGRCKVNVDVAIKLAELFGEEILEPVSLDEFGGTELNVAPHTELEAELLDKSDAVHVPKGKVSVGGRLEDKEFAAVVPHGNDNLEWFAELSKIIRRISVAIGFSDVPKELESSKVEVAQDLQHFLRLLKEGVEG